MGACYTVNIKMNGDRETILRALESAIRDEIEGGGCIITVDPAIKDPMERFMSALLPNMEQDEDGTYRADFDASYGWELVLEDIFSEVLKSCDPGSFIEVLPDNWGWILKVQESGIVREDFDEEDEEDDEDETAEEEADEYLGDYLDCTIFAVENYGNNREIHYFGYVYGPVEDGETPFRGLEYCGFFAPLQEAIDYGILKYEQDHCETAKTYIADLTEKGALDFVLHSDNGKKPTEIHENEITIKTPEGCYILV